MTLVGWDRKVSFEYFAFHLGHLLSQSRSDNLRFLAVAAKCRQQRAEVSHTNCTYATRKLSRCRSQLRSELSQVPKFLVQNWDGLTFFWFQFNFNYFWWSQRPLMSSQESKALRPRTVTKWICWETTCSCISGVVIRFDKVPFLHCQ